MSRLGWSVFLALLGLVAVAGPGPKFTKVRIMFMRDGKGDFYGPPRKYILTDPAKIDAFVACLTGFGEKKLPLKPAGWSARTMVELFPEKGPSMTVYLSSTYTLWSMRGVTGDGKPKPAIKAILDEAEKLAKPLSP